MKDAAIALSLSDWINVALCLLSFILATISVVIVVVSVRQNSKMIENSTRPYISIYINTTNFQNPSLYLVLKNFGQSAALITEFEPEIDLSAIAYEKDFRPFSYIKESTIAPGQAFLCSIDLDKIEKVNPLITFNIAYTWNRKSYKETHSVNLKAHHCNVQVRAATKDNESTIISYTLQSLVERFL